MCGGAAQNHHSNCTKIESGVAWLLCIVLQDALNEVLKVYAPMTVRVFVDDTAVNRKGEEL